MSAPAQDQQAAACCWLQRQIRGLKVPLRVTVDLRPTGTTLPDPRFGPAVLRFLLECGARPSNLGSRECHGCCERCALDRPIVGVEIVEYLSVECAGFVGQCPECLDPPDRLQIAIDRFKLNFALGSIETSVGHQIANRVRP